MDSLPEQHVDSLPNWKREEAYRHVGMVCAYRIQGLSEDEVAKKVKFDSVEDMYFRLKRWGLSGLVPLEEESEETPKTARERKARGSGPVVELPSASNAIPLFREKLDLLKQANEDLKYREEKYQAGPYKNGKYRTGRFLASSVHRSTITLRREDWSEEEWRGATEQYGVDAGGNTIAVDDGLTFAFGDATHAPQAPLPALIAACILAGGEMAPLLDALYPGTPTQEVREEIRMLVEGKKGTDNKDGLKTSAEKLATWLRGGRVERGTNPDPIPPLDRSLACRIRERREAGVPDKQIYEDLRLRKEHGGEGFTWKEFRRLADLGLVQPWE